MPDTESSLTPKVMITASLLFGTELVQGAKIEFPVVNRFWAQLNTGSYGEYLHLGSQRLVYPWIRG